MGGYPVRSVVFSCVFTAPVNDFDVDYRRMFLLASRARFVVVFSTAPVNDFDIFITCDK